MSEANSFPLSRTRQRSDFHGQTRASLPWSNLRKPYAGIAGLLWLGPHTHSHEAPRIWTPASTHTRCGNVPLDPSPHVALDRPRLGAACGRPTTSSSPSLGPARARVSVPRCTSGPRVHHRRISGPVHIADGALGRVGKEAPRNHAVTCWRRSAGAALGAAGGYTTEGKFGMTPA